MGVGAGQLAVGGAREARLPAGWPLYATFVGFPVWWVLGLGEFVWIVMAVPMAGALVMARTVRAPRGFGVWLLFLVWMLGSVLQLDQASRLYAFGYRAGLYLSATVLFLYVYNLPAERVPARRLVGVVAGFWAVVVAGGFLGMAVPEGELTTPAELLAPAGMLADPFVRDLLHPGFAQVQDFLGYPVPRPAAPFVYTNEWGANLALLTPLAVAAVGLASGWRRQLLVAALVASVVPVVVSLDRGVWLSLGVGLVYVAVRVALRGRVRALVGVVALLAVLTGAVMLSPLRELVTDRVATPHSNERRGDLSEQAIEGWQRRPVFGYGGTRPSDRPNQPSVGTHGQLWLVLFSHGLPGALLFLGWLALALAASARGASGFPLWAHVTILIACLQLPYYAMLPAQLHVVMVAAALAWRERDAQDEWRRRRY